MADQLLEWQGNNKVSKSVAYSEPVKQEVSCTFP